jgi:hypothetical protein
MAKTVASRIFISYGNTRSGWARGLRRCRRPFASAMGAIAKSSAVFLQLVLAAATISMAAAQQDETINLFEPSTQRQTPPSGGAIPGLTQDAVGAVSFFSISPAARQSLGSSARGERTLRIALPGGQSVTCRFAVQESGSDLFEGTVVDGEPLTDRCDLVVAGGEVIGDIEIESGHYRIIPMGEGGTHAIVEIKGGAYPNEGEPVVPPLGVQRKGERSVLEAERCDVALASGQSPKELGPIRILVLYTPAAAAQAGNIKADITLLMRQLNDALSADKNGGSFSVQTELAHAQKLSFVEANHKTVGGKRVLGIQIDLNRLAELPDVASLRDQYEADLVHLLIGKKAGNPCGIGFKPPLWGIGFDTVNLGFSVSERDCAINNYSFTHELGHNLGLDHDRYVARTLPPSDYNVGLVATRKRIRTVMSYDDECRDRGYNCARLLVFSTPRITVKGVAMGKPYDQPNGAYNVEILCRTAPIVADYY